MNRYMCWAVIKGISYRGWVWAWSGEEAEKELCRRVANGETKGLEIVKR